MDWQGFTLDASRSLRFGINSNIPRFKIQEFLNPGILESIKNQLRYIQFLFISSEIFHKLDPLVSRRIADIFFEIICPEIPGWFGNFSMHPGF